DVAALRRRRGAERVRAVRVREAGQCRVAVGRDAGLAVRRGRGDGEAAGRAALEVDAVAAGESVREAGEGQARSARRGAVELDGAVVSDCAVNVLPGPVTAAAFVAVTEPLCVVDEASNV